MSQIFQFRLSTSERRNNIYKHVYVFFDNAWIEWWGLRTLREIELFKREQAIVEISNFTNHTIWSILLLDASMLLFTDNRYYHRRRFAEINRALTMDLRETFLEIQRS